MSNDIPLAQVLDSFIFLLDFVSGRHKTQGGIPFLFFLSDLCGSHLCGCGLTGVQHTADSET